MTFTFAIFLALFQSIRWRGLKKTLYMAGEIGVEPGEMICSSKGLHLYDMYWELAKRRLGAQ